MQHKKLIRSMSLPLALLLLALCMFLLPRLLSTTQEKANTPSPEPVGPSQLVAAPRATTLSSRPQPPDKCCLLQQAIMDDRPFARACPVQAGSPGAPVPDSFPWLLWVRHYLPAGNNAPAHTAY